MPSSLVADKANYAPFSSSSERNINALQSDFIPGPGEYAREKTYAYSDASNAVFTSKSNRLEFSESEIRAKSVPGPGAYVVQQDWNKSKGGVKVRRKEEDRGVQWVRVAAVPSIPNQRSSFGYEESPLGDLVPQNAPYRTFSGVGEDRIGPGHYDVRDEILQHGQKGTHWAKSRAHRSGMNIKVPKGMKPVPGPGRYDPHVPSESYLVTKPTSTFASGSKRWDKFTDSKAPGPGTYRAKSSFDPHPDGYIPEAYQYFGSKVDRKLTHIDMKNPVPGPGTYTMGSLFTGRKKEDDLEETGPLPFQSTSQRFTERHEAVPGPGAYTELNNLSYDLSKKVFSRNQSFGSTMKRFYKNKETRDEIPGPAAYEEKVLVQPKRQGTQFRSKVERFPRKSASSTVVGPAPGYYDTDIGRIEREKIMQPSHVKQTFLSKQERFDTQAEVKTMLLNSHLGPGRYNAHTKKLITAVPTAPSVSSVFKSDERRFQDPVGARQEVPGPGQYELNASMVKRTFNITIGGI